MTRPKTIPVSIRRLTLLGWIGCTSCLGTVASPGCASSRYLADAPPTVAPEHSLPIQPELVASRIAASGRAIQSPLARTSTKSIPDSSDAIEPNEARAATIRLASARLNQDVPKPFATKTATTQASRPKTDQSQTVKAMPELPDAAPNESAVTSAVAINKADDDTARNGDQAPPSQFGTLTINGQQYTIQLAEPKPSEGDSARSDHSLVALPTPMVKAVQTSDAMNESDLIQEVSVTQEYYDESVYHAPVVNETMVPVDSADDISTLDLNLPSALAMIDAKHPAVGLAQWRVQEAYARLSQAEVMWLPTIQAGLSFHRHDGNYQSSNGDIVDVNRNSMQYGLGMGATGAGTTQRPGLVAQFHLADALFQPKIAERNAWARGHAAKAVVNDQLLRVAIAYNDLLRAHQDLRIVEESRDRMNELFKITDDFAQAGQGLRADADRVETERLLVQRSIAEAQEAIATASARLAEALSIDASTTIMPMDVNAVALDLNPPGLDKASLIQTGLTNRPELKESQALVAAACEAYQREKYSPLVPSVLLGFSTGGFGGGLGGDVDDTDGRYDFDALMSWEVRNLGFGEKAARRLTSSQVEQAKYEKIRVMDEVARQVSEAHSQLDFRRQQMSLTQSAIRSAQASYERNVSRIRDGQGLPIEVLQSVQALETARRAYLRSVVDYNESQFRLQWALGWPVSQG
ncbi:TolC family protein [Neorhodopirellula pilleata]|uniref:Outer membrane efflux protein n=1 Tax=Neorhodopirellula pilleata TaxID=2714738 RepID=A0A5C6ABY3_9BACT|nr:TolC family protein [Neorhodopirellula pilleata]TWT97099.1 Outer membrane efflux protein [Neorhodopirellula pilleata]